MDAPGILPTINDVLFVNQKIKKDDDDNDDDDDDDDDEDDEEMWWYDVDIGEDQ